MRDGRRPPRDRRVHTLHAAREQRRDRAARAVAADVPARLAARGQRFADQAIDLATERFDVYVPAAPPPPAGYALTVFAAPWPDATRPRRWLEPLDRHGVVFVSARDSGNDPPVLDRRLPLVLLAYEDVRARRLAADGSPSTPSARSTRCSPPIRRTPRGSPPDGLSDSVRAPLYPPRS
ncbi:MAG: hypothetical protein ACM31C_13545 [Acidobacteriota bacterium]